MWGLTSKSMTFDQLVFWTLVAVMLFIIDFYVLGHYMIIPILRSTC